MRFNKQIFLGVLTAALLFSCANATNPASTSSSSSAASTFTVPVTSAADDKLSTGVYKGIIAYENSGGDLNIEIKRTATPSIRAVSDYQATMNIRINNNISKVTGTIVSDSGSNLTIRFQWTQLSKNYDVTLSVSSTGYISISTLTVNSVNTSFSGVRIYKETSTVPVSVWVGTFSGSGSSPGGTTSITGVFNYIVQGTSLLGVWAGQVTAPSGLNYDGNYFSGSAGTSISITLPSTGSGPGTASGTVTGSSVTGTWTKDGLSGTWNGTKTM